MKINNDIKNHNIINNYNEVDSINDYLLINNNEYNSYKIFLFKSIYSIKFNKDNNSIIIYKENKKVNTIIYYTSYLKNKNDIIKIEI